MEYPFLPFGILSDVSARTTFLTLLVVDGSLAARSILLFLGGFFKDCRRLAGSDDFVHCDANARMIPSGIDLPNI